MEFSTDFSTPKGMSNLKAKMQYHKIEIYRYLVNEFYEKTLTMVFDIFLV